MRNSTYWLFGIPFGAYHNRFYRIFRVNTVIIGMKVKRLGVEAYVKSIQFQLHPIYDVTMFACTHCQRILLTMSDAEKINMSLQITAAIPALKIFGQAFTRAYVHPVVQVFIEIEISYQPMSENPRGRHLFSHLAILL
jgi:hypothetical protein